MSGIIRKDCVDLTIEEVKRLANAWSDMLKAESEHTKTSDVIAIVQLQALVQIYEKLDSMEQALFILRAG